MASNSNQPNNEMWNEHQWEAHINEIERKTHQLRKFMDNNTDPEQPRWAKILKDSNNEDDAVRSFIEEELALEEAYFPDEEDEDWDDEMDDWDDDFLLGEDFDILDEEEDDFEEGDEWKRLSSDYAMTDEGSIENLHIYNEARVLSVDILKWVKNLSDTSHSIAHNQFVSQSLQIAAKIAAGYSFGFDQELIGGNIAYCKKALRLANNALSLLQRVKKAPSTNPEIYYYLHAKLFELRNDIGIYVQDLRDIYHRGGLI